jgi:hypothetical protein
MERTTSERRKPQHLSGFDPWTEAAAARIAARRPSFTLPSEACECDSPL